MSDRHARRDALKTLGLAAGSALLGASRVAQAATPEPGALLPGGATRLADLTRRLAAAPRRRDFKTVPMILERPDQWDHAALTEVIGYRGGPKQAWDNTELGGPWLNLMRNALNAQIWSFRHPDFLVVSATHGTAHLALFDQTAWDKYGLATFAGAAFATNTLLAAKPAQAKDPSDHELADGAFSSHDNSIAALLQRGVVFLSCHNAIWELAQRLDGANANPDKLPLDALAADLTNHVIPSAIVTPGAVGTLPELQLAGFTYAK
ncbi:transcriptional initiation protein Tat [Burkholderia sp. IDO3]|uniref:thiosulfate dehydrogenase n=1 Tax=Burkholderia sp. IDO3 TaxID=1705310 RepID=UPI000BBB1E13|nr:transcriptional initiation protein Tat [Burkholderia sp. IDO3]AXK63387.1 transcriptional initiation protein Tat [Burkholderia sp. IDO3]PCD58357.1 transcriptional initiation protein Tat [Burkholderia sp. IDO3]